MTITVGRCCAPLISRYGMQANRHGQIVSMAKVSMINRELRRQRVAARFAAKRAAIKAVLRNPETSDEDRWEAQIKLQKLPRNASPCRQVRRCALTGRPHAVYRRFGLARTKLREAAMRGDVPGLVKSSW